MTATHPPETAAHEPTVLSLTLAEVEIVNGWYWHKVDTKDGTDDEDDALYRRIFRVIDGDERRRS